jgi:acetoin utilization deacetylase AcuC-like enzyme
VNRAGGTHHAFRDHGEGYCVFDDSAIAALVVQAEGRVRRGAIRDCDAHEGNGTASILANDPTVFNFPIHEARNFPFRKETSDLDIELPDGTAAADYLDALQRGFCNALSAAQPELAIYLAGADPCPDERLGRLALSKEGLRARFGGPGSLPYSQSAARDRHGGGYSTDIADTVDIHFSTVEVAAHFQSAAQQFPALSSPETS